jgi:branched-chain amino acid transport system ATP-binding protein
MLEVADVAVAYGRVPALAGISLDVTSGSITAIVGSNGAGKTTLLKTVIGHLKPSRGEIRLDGKPITGGPAHAVARMGLALVPEGRGLFADMTVEENLMLGAYAVRDRATVEGSLAHVYSLFPRLADRRRQISGTMSGGEQQLLSIARGLMSAPRLLMLDEPSLGVMPAFVNRIFEVLAELRDAGTTILLVEQNVERSLRAADHAYVLQAGRIVAAGAGSELLESDLVRRAYLGV